MPTVRFLTPHELRIVAVAAGCEPRTVLRFLAGDRQHSTTHERIARAMEVFEREHGVTPVRAGAVSPDATVGDNKRGGTP